MKKLIISFIFLTSITFSQIKWEILNPSPTYANILDTWIFNDSTFIITGNAGLCMKTFNGGKNWTICSVPTMSEIPDVFFVNSQTGYLFSNDKKLYKSVDGGLTWFHNADLPGYHPQVIYFTDVNNGYFGNENKLLKTTNGGSSWQSSILNGYIYELKVTDSALYVSTDYGGSNWGGALLKSTNSGASWDTIVKINAHFIKGFDLNSNGVIICGGDSFTSISTDNGITWDLKFNSGTTYFEIKFIDDTTVVLAGTPSLVSSDAGTTWKGINGSNYMRSVESAGNLTLVTGNEGLIFASLNKGMTWQSLKQGKSYLPYSVFFTSADTAYFTGFEYINGMKPFVKKTTDGCSTWVNLPWSNVSLAPVDITFIDSGNTGVAILPKLIMRTTDGGMSWSEVAVNVSADEDLKKIVFVDDQYGYVLGTPHFILKTTDGGISWEKIQLNTNLILSGIKFLNKSTGFITGSEASVFKTTDGGLSWNMKKKFVTGRISGIQFYNDNDGRLFHDARTYKTTDGGESWTIESYTIASIVDFYDKNNGMAAIAGGNSLTIGISRNGGDWHKEDIPIQPAGTFMKMADPSTAYIFGHSGVIIRLKDKSYTSVREETGAGTVKDFSLSQNYPNPFNPETVIRFSLPEAGFVKGVVYDILGREVATLLKSDMTAGNHQVKFDATGIASGVYVFRLEAGNHSSAIKMVVGK